MAITLRTNKQGLAIIDEARSLKNWSALAIAWCEKANVSVSTLKRFRERKAIQKDAFVAICQAVGVKNWEIIVANPAHKASVLAHHRLHSKQQVAQEVLSNLSHLDARLDVVEHPFSERSAEGQLQVVRHHITPALIQDINTGYGQLMRQQVLNETRSEKSSQPLTIEATVSIIQITVSA